MQRENAATVSRDEKTTNAIADCGNLSFGYTSVENFGYTSVENYISISVGDDAKSLFIKKE
ncbi:hypothetical protein [Roseofilum casamattae]|uniref:Uncharacterized protein n=1 Tax=Roseofilum casamattae BLCC-M143 TaxID=3022442 RepID=A0ABT7C319_9CYAN|nr:hypothetical protein [Roseofilum casamattae]MDJ1185134.1 hypothetical protein [Roseofilum casamattae BLCC-M143]